MDEVSLVDYFWYAIRRGREVSAVSASIPGLRYLTKPWLKRLSVDSYIKVFSFSFNFSYYPEQKFPLLVEWCVLWIALLSRVLYAFSPSFFFILAIFFFI